MTLFLIGPICEDLIIIGNDKSSKIGGASFYQSFVFEEFYEDYLIIVNTNRKDLISKFPNQDKVKLILKEDSHYFINEYPNKDNLDIRNQFTNFPNIPILIEDLEPILANLNKEKKNIDCNKKDYLDYIIDGISNSSNLYSLEENNETIDAFILNPLNSNDIPYETVEYLKEFNIPIFLSLQGFLRFKGNKDSFILKSSDNLKNIISNVDAIFMDEEEYKYISQLDFEFKELIITNGSFGSRVIFNKKFVSDYEEGGSFGSRVIFSKKYTTNYSKNEKYGDFLNQNNNSFLEEINISAVKSSDIVDATGCGDTFMAAYISHRLNGFYIKKSAEFASKIASSKLKVSGPYKKINY